MFLCGGVGEWFWKYLAGINPTSPAFTTVAIAPMLELEHGPRSLDAEFLSASGPIGVAWRIEDAVSSGAHGVSLNVSLPIGVTAASVVVPKPFVASKPAAAAVVTEGGEVVWDGTQLVGRVPGIVSAVDRGPGVELRVLGSAQYEFGARVAQRERPQVVGDGR